MSSIDDWTDGGIFPMRDHSPRTDIAMRNVRMGIRLGSLPDRGFGTDRDDMGVVTPDMKEFGAPEDTVGDWECWGLWQRDPSSAEDRGIAGWANAWPAITRTDEVAPAPNDGPGGGLTTGPPASLPTPMVRTVRNVNWVDDTRFMKKAVSFPKCVVRLANGWPLIVIPGTEERVQNDLGFPVGGLCVAVHYGGGKHDTLGSRVYDVTTTGDLDTTAWAREHSGRRVYVLPTSTGAGGFKFTETSASPLGTKSATPELAPGGLAWQLGPTVADQAGHGACSDLPSFSAPPAIVDGPGGSLGTTSKPIPGSIAGLSQGPAAQKGLVGAGQLKITFFGGFGTSFYNIPWDGNPATIAWILKNGEQAGYAAGGRIVKVEQVGSVSPPPPPPAPAGGTTGGTGPTGSLPQTALALATYRAYGPHDCGGPGCPHLIHTNTRGENIYSLHQRETTIIRGDTGDASAKHDVTPWKKVDKDGPFWLECYRRMDMNDQHQWLTGKLAGLRKIQVSYHLGTPTGYPTDGPTKGGSTRTGGELLDTFTAACVGKSSYPSFSQAVGITEILGRVTGYNVVSDSRYRSSLDVGSGSLNAWNEAPVASKIQPVADMTVRPKLDCTYYRTGHSLRGGFVFAPADYDVYKDQRGEPQCSCATGEAYVYLTGKTALVFGTATKSAKPKNAIVFKTVVDSPGIVYGQTTDSNGNVTSTVQLWPPSTAGTNIAPQGYISGWNLAYNSGSPSATDVSGSVARDTTNTYDITLAGPVSADYLSNGGPLKNDAFVFADTAITGGSSHGTVGGTAINFGASALSGDIRPFLNGRTLTGSMAVAARNAGTKLQQITGSGGSKFLTEVAVGDVIGNSTTGYGMVAQVDSDTACWIIKEFSDLSSSTYSGQTFSCYENVCVQIGATPSCRISEISKDGLHIYSPTIFNGGVEDGLSHNMIVGQPAAALPGTGAGALGWPWPNGTVNVQTTTWIYLWARRKVDGTTTVSWSTQRTTPYTPATLSGYSIWRRVAVLPIDYDNFVIPFTQSNLGPHRLYMFEGDNSSLYSPWKALDNAHGSTGAWVRLALQRAVPPTSKLALVLGECVGRNAGAGTTELYLRAASVGAAGLQRPRRVIADAVNGFNDSEFLMPTDAAQCIDYVTVSAGLGDASSILVLGYYDVP